MTADLTPIDLDNIFLYQSIRQDRFGRHGSGINPCPKSRWGCKSQEESCTLERR